MKDNRLRQQNRLLRTHLLVLGSLTLAGVILFMSQPASPQNQIVFSFSLTQILFGLGWLLVSSLCLWGSRKVSRPGNELAKKVARWLENPLRMRLILLGSAEILLLTLLTFFLAPNPAFGRLTGYLIRVRPFIGWLVLISLQFIVLIVQLNRNPINGKPFAIQRKQIFFFIFTLFFLCILWAGICITGFGVGTDSDVVRTPTIFITFNQFFIALLITSQIWIVIQYAKIVLDSEQQRNLRMVAPLLLAMVIWTAAFMIWVDEPIRSSYYRIGPFPPNNDYIPAADSTRFDLPGQLALIGEGLNARKYIDNPFYVFVVMIFRILGGQFYDRMIIYQIAALAFIPVGLFVIGRMYSGKYLGLLLAILTIIREKNIIQYSADTWLSPVKALLTEPFISLLLLLFCLFFIKWLRDDLSTSSNIALAGGLFGLSTLVRTNPWFLLPVSGGVIFLKMRFKLRKAIYPSIIFGAAVMVSIFPWMLRSQATIDTPFYFLFKMQHSVVEERYGHIGQDEINGEGPDKDAQPPELNPDDGKLTTDEAIKDLEPRPTGIVTENTDNIDDTGNTENQAEKENAHGSKIASLIGEHFIFNMVNSVQILPSLLPNSTPGTPVIFPTSVFMADKAVGLWRMLAGNLSILFILTCISAGISLNDKLPAQAAVFPLLFFLTYGAGTAVALTSASRYTQPVEWVVLLYFCSGFLILWRMITKPFLETISEQKPMLGEQPEDTHPEVENRRYKLRTFVPILVFFLVIGSLIPLSDFIFPKKYMILPKEELLKMIDVPRAAATSGMSAEEYTAYINHPETGIIEGRLVYAQYYQAGEGEDISRMRVVIYDYPRITFELLGPYKPSMNVLLPLEEPWPDKYLNGQTAVVIGCPSGGGIDAMSVILPDMNIYLARTKEIPQVCR